MAERGAQIVAARNLVAQTGQGTAPRGRSGVIRVQGSIAGQQYSQARFDADGTARVQATAPVTSTPWGTRLSSRLHKALRSFHVPLR